LISVTFVLWILFTQIALGIVCWQKLKTKQFYGSILGTIRFRCCSWSLLDPVNAVLIHQASVTRSFYFYFLSPLLGWIISKLEKNRIDFLTYVAFGVCLPMCIRYVYLLGTQFMAFRLSVCTKTIFVVDLHYSACH
jgi:inner membrane protein